jgi:hypothetical protein
MSAEAGFRFGFERPQYVHEAKEEIMASMEAGDSTDCPCCNQKVKLYKRPLNSQMAMWLIALVKAYRAQGRKGWIAVTDEPFKSARGGDYAKLQHWGLIEQCPNDDPKKRTSGLWRPTNEGILFADNKTLVASHVHIYNNTVMGWSQEMIAITDALGKKFDYREVISAALNKLTF